TSSFLRATGASIAPTLWPTASRVWITSARELISGSPLRRTRTARCESEICIRVCLQAYRKPCYECAFRRWLWSSEFHRRLLRRQSHADHWRTHQLHPEESWRGRGKAG